MPASPPAPHFSENDKRLLVLLGRLLTERDMAEKNNNINKDYVTITDSEASELYYLIEKLINSREFIEEVYFIEKITSGGEDARLRELYLSSRKRHGRSRALASTHWADFKRRLGIYNQHHPLVNTSVMEFSYFIKLEEVLLKSSGLPSSVVREIMEVLKNNKNSIENARYENKPHTNIKINDTIIDPLKKVARDRSKSALREITTRKLMGAVHLIADAGVLFTTRDWSVAGTISGLASSLVAINRD